jgi:hypothetical protein
VGRAESLKGVREKERYFGRGVRVLLYRDVGNVVLRGLKLLGGL